MLAANQLVIRIQKLSQKVCPFAQNSIQIKSHKLCQRVCPFARNGIQIMSHKICQRVCPFVQDRIQPPNMVHLSFPSLKSGREHKIGCWCTHVLPYSEVRTQHRVGMFLVEPHMAFCRKLDHSKDLPEQLEPV